MASGFNDETSLFNFVIKDGNGVKGLADKGLTEVPYPFIQPLNHRINKQVAAVTPENMITIDISELDGPNHDQVVKLIAHASETLGFFQVVNHGVPLKLLDSLKAAAHQFFSQPTEMKAMYLKPVSPSPMVKYGTSFASKDGQNIFLQWRDFVNMIYTNDADALDFWPNECREVALDYIKTSREMVKKLLQALISILGVKLDDSILEPLIGSKKVHMNFYPPCPNPELTIGVMRHSDMGMLTVLLQDDIGGLYMKIGETQEWIEVPPIHGALVINIGDTLQILSNGRYTSPEHKVGTTSTASRVSIPLFYNPLPEAKTAPLTELVTRDGLARYRELTFEEYTNNLYQRDNYQGKNALQYASI